VNKILTENEEFRRVMGVEPDRPVCEHAQQDRIHEHERQLGHHLPNEIWSDIIERAGLFPHKHRAFLRNYPKISIESLQTKIDIRSELMIMPNSTKNSAPALVLYAWKPSVPTYFMMRLHKYLVVADEAEEGKVDLNYVAHVGCGFVAKGVCERPFI
jgi:hypothetical protein